MPYKIAIASGKGGTGKTTVAVNLYHFFNKNPGKKIQLVDCDVEEPNALIFFPVAIKKKENNILRNIPEIDIEKCNYCQKCANYCEFNAIVIIPPVRFTDINSNLCHSCGACLVACEKNAITEKTKLVGKVAFYQLEQGEGLTEGKLEIGSAMQTMLIKELKKKISGENDIIIYDAPPGTSCPVVETISDVNYVVLVTEPTPFGLYDLKLMVELLKEIEKPFGIIINKVGLGNTAIYEYIEKEKIELLGEIPFKKKYAVYYAYGNLFKKIPNDITGSYLKIIEKLERKIIVYEGNNHLKW